MSAQKRFYFLTPTWKFAIAGLFIPGFTAILLLGLQMAITFLGVACHNAWTVLWTLTTIGAIAAPIILLMKMNKRLLQGYNLTAKEVTIFNVIEYTCIQCSLAATLTTGHTLCYVGDGQNGLEFGFTAWVAIPILIILSLVFEFFRNKIIENLNVEDIVN
jgi:hypothetical protein